LSGPLITCRFDQRFCYALTSPRVPGVARGLLVTVHNSVRWYHANLLGFRAFAERHGLFMLAPIFPAGLLGRDDEDCYKFLLERGVRHDLVLNAMVEEAAQTVGCDGSKFLLHGYSGGAQFVHRYLLLHPGRVRAAAIGAPGAVTLIDDEVDWWGGVRDLHERFGQTLDLDALRRVPIQLVVGENDTEVEPLRVQPPSRFWRSDAERLNASRIDRLQAFRRSLAEAGVASEFEVMRGLLHGEGDGPSIALAEGFFAEELAQVPASRG
jgi:pimeloyl-ACP methyl ester carboxylesterase